MEDDECITLIEGYLSTTECKQWSYTNFLEVNRDAILKLELTTPNCTPEGLSGKWNRRWQIQILKKNLKKEYSPKEQLTKGGIKKFWKQLNAEKEKECEVAQHFQTTAYKILEVAGTIAGQKIIDNLETTTGKTSKKRQLEEDIVSENEDNESTDEDDNPANDDNPVGWDFKTPTYILYSGRNVEDIMREVDMVTTEDANIYIGLHVIDLSSNDNRYGFQISEWTQIREDFQTLIRPLDCILTEPFVRVLSIRIVFTSSIL